MMRVAAKWISDPNPPTTTVHLRRCSDSSDGKVLSTTQGILCTRAWRVYSLENTPGHAFVRISFPKPARDIEGQPISPISFIGGYYVDALTVRPKLEKNEITPNEKAGFLAGMGGLVGVAGGIGTVYAGGTTVAGGLVSVHWLGRLLVERPSVAQFF